MSDEYVSLQVHKEFEKRVEEENERQNERILKLENTLEKIHDLAASTNDLAHNMEQMLREQKAQGNRISRLEEQDGEKWRGAVKIVATALLSALVGAVLMKLGFQV